MQALESRQCPVGMSVSRAGPTPREGASRQLVLGRQQPRPAVLVCDQHRDGMKASFLSACGHSSSWATLTPQALWCLSPPLGAELTPWPIRSPRSLLGPPPSPVQSGASGLGYQEATEAAWGGKMRRCSGGCWCTTRLHNRRSRDGQLFKV